MLEIRVLCAHRNTHNLFTLIEMVATTAVTVAAAAQITTTARQRVKIQVKLHTFA